MVLVTHPELVHMERVPEQPAKPLNWLEHLPATITGIGWYDAYPDYYAGDARLGSIGKGKVRVDLMGDCLSEYIAAVKADKIVPALNTEFYERVRKQS